ncbi:MAG: glycosyltransferase [Bacteriovoracaceae bacterium]|nr:glycosyltransferase [Bacteriovoracaceae bacterium]
MKVVLLHDWLTGFRGGERVLEVFCEMFPDAPLYTLLHQKGCVPSSIEDRKIVTSFLDNVPGVYEQYRKFLPMFPKAADGLKIVEDADVVLSSSHCVIKGVKKPAGSVHVSYIHSPMRYLYDQYDSYFGPDAPFYQRAGMKVFKGYLTNWDKESNSNVDHFVANSSFVRERVKKYYERDADVIHPFVDLADFRTIQDKEQKKDGYFVMVTAFAPNKRVDLAVRTFNELGLNLKIIGSGQQERELRDMANSNVEFLGNVSREEVISCFNNAEAMIFPGVEDFGITPLESLASGTPVIAYKAGGVLETLNDDVAVFFDEPTVESLSHAVKVFKDKSFNRDKLFERAEDFSKNIFKKNIMDYVEGKLR